MKTKVFPTQEEDAEHQFVGEDIPNYSEPGTGKTLTTIRAIEKAKHQSGLIVAPVIALPMWKAVIEHELGAKAQILRTGKDVIDPLSDFRIVSYPLVGEHYAALMEGEQDALVLDEAHYLKSSESKRTKAIFGEDCSGAGGVYERCLQCYSLTGTPIERYADDLWSQLRAIQPQALARYSAWSLDAFQLNFCSMEWKEYAGGAVRKWVSTGNTDTRRLQKLLYDEVGAIRRTMKDVEEFMPPIVERNINIPMSSGGELKDLLKGLKEEDIERMLLEGDEHMSRARRLLGIAKVKETVAYIKTIAVHRPVLVGFWHTDVGKEITQRLTKAGVDTALIDGSVSSDKREGIKQDFMLGRVQVIVGQISAMGVALDGLQSAGQHVIFAEDEWAPSKVEQFMRRIWRMGQKQHVQVDFCKADNPVDKAIERIRLAKAGGIAQILHRP